MIGWIVLAFCAGAAFATAIVGTALERMCREADEAEEMYLAFIKNAKARITIIDET